MRRCWLRFLDRVLPRYVVGVDPITPRSIGCVTCFKARRDGTYELVGINYGRTPYDDLALKNRLKHHSLSTDHNGDADA